MPLPLDSRLLTGDKTHFGPYLAEVWSL